MSYILNALRKSEQNRRNNQTPTLDNAASHPQPVQEKSRSVLILALVLIIVLMAIALFWFYFKQSPEPAEADHLEQSIQPSQANKQIEPDIEPQPVKKVQPQQNQQPEEQLHEPETDPIAESEPQPDPPGFAEIIAQKKLKPVERNEPEKPMTEYQELVSNQDEALDLETALEELSHQSPGLPSQTAAPDRDEQPASTMVPNDHKQAPNSSETAPIRNTVVTTKPKSRKPVQTGYDFSVPFLKDMPFNFRRNVPKVNINVYVYADQPKERFVLVDMEKYKAGEEIAEGMKLKQILSDALVVTYEGKTFKIKRP